MSSFSIAAGAIAAVGISGGAGVLLAATGTVDTRSLNRVVLNVFLPSLLLMRTMGVFESNQSGVLGAVVFQIFTMLTSGILGWIISRFTERKHQIATFLLSTINNNAYVPLGIISFLVPEEEAERGIALVSVFVVGGMLVIWTVGDYLFRYAVEQEKRESAERENEPPEEPLPSIEPPSISSPDATGQEPPKTPIWRRFLNLPLIGILLGVLLGAVGAYPWISSSILGRTAVSLGAAVVPCALVLLGSLLWIGRHRGAQVPISSTFLVLFIRLVVAPGLGLLFLTFVLVPTGLVADGTLFMVCALESSMPPAVNVLNLAELHRSPSLDLVARTMLVTYSFALLSVGVWIVVFLSVSGGLFGG